MVWIISNLDLHKLIKKIRTNEFKKLKIFVIPKSISISLLLA